MSAYHKTKDEVVEAFWQKMKEAGADEGLIACVSAETLELVPPDPDQIDGYHELVDKVIEVAWRRGVHDTLTAFEVGALHGIIQEPRQGQN